MQKFKMVILFPLCLIKTILLRHHSSFRYFIFFAAIYVLLAVTDLVRIYNIIRDIGYDS